VSRDQTVSQDGPKGFHPIGLFLFCGATIASISAIPLLWPGTPLDRLWSLNPKAYRQIAPWGSSIGILFLLLGVALATAGVGWFERRVWGWRLTVAIAATHLLGDAVNCIRGQWLAGTIGVIFAGTLLLILLRPAMRSAFR